MSRRKKDHAEVAGKPSGVQWHTRRHEDPCDECREAIRAYMRQRNTSRHRDGTVPLVPRINWDPAAA